MTTLLIDGDIVAHSIASAVEEPIDWGDGLWTYHANESEATTTVDNLFKKWKEVLDADKIVCALTDYEKNFRKLVDASYKAQRKNKQKPLLFRFLGSYMKNHYRTFQFSSLEGDDVLGILATNTTLLDSDPEDRIIVSIDKDMKTIAGKLFNPDKDNCATYISADEANYNFYKQVLMGDRADGYPGCPTIGEKGAEKLLSLVEPDEYWEVVVNCFKKHKLKESDAIKQARLAWILKDGDYNFETGSVKLWEPNLIQV